MVSVIGPQPMTSTTLVLPLMELFPKMPRIMIQFRQFSPNPQRVITPQALATHASLLSTQIPLPVEVELPLLTITKAVVKWNYIKNTTPTMMQTTTETSRPKPRWPTLAPLPGS